MPAFSTIDKNRNHHWAIVGLGRAGNIRMRNLRADPQLGALTLCSRRDQSHPSFAQVLHDKSVTGVFLCRESENHSGDARQALSAGKHVLVEYPLAFTKTEGVELYELARQVGCVLHVGFLGLLHGWSGDVSNILKQNQVHSAHYDFRAGFGGVPQSDADGGRLGTMVLSRIQQLIVWFGHLELIRCSMNKQADGIHVNVVFKSRQGQEIKLSESRRRSQKRMREISLLNRDGELIHVPKWYSNRQVFAMDTACFIDRCFGQAIDGTWIVEADVLHGLGLAEAISKALNSTGG